MSKEDKEWRWLEIKILVRRGDWFLEEIRLFLVKKIVRLLIISRNVRYVGI